MQKLFLSREELAAMLGTKPQTLAMWACRGRGPRFRKRGRRVVYHAGDVAAWLDDPARYEAAHTKTFARTAKNRHACR